MDLALENDILAFVKEQTGGKNTKRFECAFWDIHNDTTVCSWGWSVPMSHIVDGVTYRIVYLSFSPEKFGDEGGVLFDYKTEKEYQQGLANGLG